MNNEIFIKNFNNRWLISVDGDFIGIVLSEKPLNFGEGLTELSGSMVKFLPVDNGGYGYPDDSGIARA